MLNLEIPGVVKVWDTICSHITGVQHLARQAGVIQTWAKSLLTHIYYAGMVWADLHLVLLRCFIDYYLIAPLTPEALITRMLSSNQQWFTPTLWGSWVALKSPAAPSGTQALKLERLEPCCTDLCCHVCVCTFICWQGLISTVKEGILTQKLLPKLGTGWKEVKCSTEQCLFELYQQHPHKSCCAEVNKKSWILCLV